MTDSTGFVLVYQKALELLREKKSKDVLTAIGKSHRVASAVFSSMQFRIVTDEPLTKRRAKNHALEHGIAWSELEPYLEKAKVYWEKLRDKS